MHRSLVAPQAGRHHWQRVVALAGCLVAVTAIAAPGADARAKKTGWAFLHDDQPTSTADFYVPGPYDQASSTGRPGSVQHIGTGAYVVFFPDLAGVGGTVLVSSESSAGKVDCAVGAFPPSTFGTSVSVFCAGPDGQAVDSAFYVTYLRTTHKATPATPAARFAYSAGGSTGPAAKSFTFSTGGKVTTKHIGTGLYQVDLAGLQTPGGSVATTAMDGHGVSCSPAAWHAEATTERVYVVCTVAGIVSDEPTFTLTFSDRTSLFGDASLPHAYVLADNATAPSYSPDLDFTANSAGGGARIVRTGTGRYSVTFPFLLGIGAAHVTASGGPSRTCQIGALQRNALDTTVQVLCFDGAGAPGDSTYALQLVGGVLP